MLIHTCGECGRKIADEELKKTHIARQGYFCPFCGVKKDGRTWKKRQTANFADMSGEKENRILETIKQNIRARQTTRRESEGLIL